MKWKFWEKDTVSQPGQAPKARKLSRPKDLPFSVGRYLVTELNCDPDWVWSLKSVSSAAESKKGQFDVLVFSEETAAAKGIEVHNVNDLMANPGLILFEGRYDKDSPKVEVKAVQRNLLRTAAA